MPGPLYGLTIIDVTTIMLGPYATQLLGDLGARIIKIETPEGDPLRQVGPSRHPGMSTTFMNINRNKESIVLDLKKASDRDRLLQLTKEADAFVHNMRPRAIERLGLGYDALKTINPSIVYAGAFGFGQSGPYADKPAYDDVIQAMSGLADLQRAFSDGPAYQATIPADKTVAVYFALAIVAALLHKIRTGEGQSVAVPMFETMAGYVLAEHLYGAGLEPAVSPPVYPRVVSPNRRPYRTIDGYVSVVAYSDQQWTRLFEAAKRRDIAADPRFATMEGRTVNVDALYGALGEVCASLTTEEALSIFDKADVPAVEVLSTSDLLSDAHLKDVGLFVMQDHPTEGRVRLVRSPFEFSATPVEIRTPAASLGQHNKTLVSDRSSGSPDGVLKPSNVATIKQIKPKQSLEDDGELQKLLTLYLTKKLDSTGALSPLVDALGDTAALFGGRLEDIFSIRRKLGLPAPELRERRTSGGVELNSERENDEPSRKDLESLSSQELLARIQAIVGKG